MSLLRTIPDPRRAESKRYGLPHILLFSILAIVTGADSYRGVCTFIKVHRKRLNASFDAVNDRKAKQVLSAFAADTHLVSAPIEIDEKSNEIPAAQTLCKSLMSLAISSRSTLFTVKKTLEIAAAAKAHVVVQLKDN